MAKVYVDQKQDKVNTWAYHECMEGQKDRVILDEDMTHIELSKCERTTLWTDDIPKLILALQGAYEAYLKLKGE